MNSTPRSQERSSLLIYACRLGNASVRKREFRIRTLLGGRQLYQTESTRFCWKTHADFAMLRFQFTVLAALPNPLWKRARLTFGPGSCRSVNKLEAPMNSSLSFRMIII